MIAIRFSHEAKEVFDFFRSNPNKENRMLFDALSKKLDLLRNDPHYGNPIKKQLIPEYYRSKYHANNLFRIELPQYWRLLYTLTSDEVQIIAFVLDVCDHGTYDKRFKYRGK